MFLTQLPAIQFNIQTLFEELLLVITDQKGDDVKKGEKRKQSSIVRRTDAGDEAKKPQEARRAKKTLANSRQIQWKVATKIRVKEIETILDLNL